MGSLWEKNGWLGKWQVEGSDPGFIAPFDLFEIENVLGGNCCGATGSVTSSDLEDSGSNQS